MKISVVVPTYNEESTIHKTLKDLITKHQPEEVIVVDGGSNDQTVELVNKIGVRLVQSGKGRAKQMNEGAELATGDVFLFLHSDTRLPDNGLELIQNAISKGREAGRFRMRFDEHNWLLRLYESYTCFHSFSYGDQGFFVRRDLFEKLEGFREEVPFEDIDFYQRLRRLTRPVIIKSPVITSARRFCGVGCLKQKFINLALVSLHSAGFNIFSLKQKFYPEIR